MAKRPTCSRCDRPRRGPNQRFCRIHHNEAMRRHRLKMGGSAALSDEQRRRQRASSYLNTYISRGKIQRGPCTICDGTCHIEGHHEDYSKPLEVAWLCRAHHRELHRLRKRAGVEFAVWLESKGIDSTAMA